MKFHININNYLEKKEGKKFGIYKLKHRKFQLNMRKNFFTVRVMKH